MSHSFTHRYKITGSPSNYSAMFLLLNLNSREAISHILLNSVISLYHGVDERIRKYSGWSHTALHFGYDPHATEFFKWLSYFAHEKVLQPGPEYYIKFIICLILLNFVNWFLI